MNLTEPIWDEATKLIRRHQSYANDLHNELLRISRRSGLVPAKSLLTPAHWSSHEGFNPYKVRPRSPSIAYGIRNALLNRDYQPRPAVSFAVPKPDGGQRVVSVFQVADNAISRVLFHQLLAKNSPRFSAHCYAYRTDITLHDAVLHIASELRGRQRVFVAEFDFRKYFDSISHEHIERILTDSRFFVTDVELHAIRAFLRTPTLEQGSYTTAPNTLRTRGIPQGTSISLFLANIAAHPLDKHLERLGVGFARFADDTLIWSDDYANICQAANALQAASVAMGVAINFDKSAGISLLTPSADSAEFRSKPCVEFLGYQISPSKIGIRQRSIEGLKQKIAWLVFSNLLREPKRANCIAQRTLPKIDRDYVTMLFQIRRYMYGNLSETQLRRYLAKASPRIQYKGLMSFYPIVDDDKLLNELDGWLLHTVYTSLRKRGRLYAQAGLGNLPQPHGLRKKELVSFYGVSSSGAKLDLRLPSFARMSKLLRSATSLHGVGAIANAATLYGSSRSTPSSYRIVIG